VYRRQIFVEITQVVLAELTGLITQRLERCGKRDSLIGETHVGSGLSYSRQAGADRQLAGDEVCPARGAARLSVVVQLRRLKEQILEFDRRILAWHRSNETSRRLDAIPGIGPALATALVASVADPKAFRSGRNFSAWIGLVPRQHSSGGKDRLGSISKQGDRYLRSLFTAGAIAVIRYAKLHGTKHRPWLTALLARRPTKVAAIALANKIARMAWAMMAKGECYREPVALAT
jgi:transposase